MKKILVALLLIFLLSGCVTYEDWVRERLDEDVNWHVRADFLSSHYPDCTDNEKALILSNQIKEHNESFRLIRRYYKTEIIYIEIEGQRIWPLYRYGDIYRGLEMIDEEVEAYSKEKEED